MKKKVLLLAPLLGCIVFLFQNCGNDIAAIKDIEDERGIASIEDDGFHQASATTQPVLGANQWAKNLVYRLDYNDEFNSRQNPSPWRYENALYGGSWLGGYRVPERAIFEGGNLVIQNRRGTRPPFPSEAVVQHFPFSDYTKTIHPSQNESAHLISKREFGYGLFEVRAKMSKGGSIDSAFWLMAGAGNGPEIDIFENFYVQDNKFVVNVSAHGRLPGASATIAKRTKALNINKPLGDEFHTYSVLWRPQSITYFFDGEAIESFKDPEILGYFENKKLSIRISTAVSNFFRGYHSTPGLNEQSWNSQMTVDYVRYFRYD